MKIFTNDCCCDGIVDYLSDKFPEAEIVENCTGCTGNSTDEIEKINLAVENAPDSAHSVNCN